jgi:dinuclear metal center YbgI/SA1388 family protein
MYECLVEDVVRLMRDWAPERWAEDFDNPGLLVGWPRERVHGIYVALDPCVQTARAALDAGCNLLVTHHPLFLSGAQKHFTAESGNADVETSLFCARNGISVYAAHTNLDRAPNGVNDCLCRTLEWENLGAVADGEMPCDDTEMPVGISRLARLPGTMTLRQAAAHVAQMLDIEGVEYVGNDAQTVSKALLCGGSGGFLVSVAAKHGAQVLVTGEAKHHERLAALACGVGLIVAGHAETEHVVLKEVAVSLQKALDAIQCKVPVIYDQSKTITHRIYR